MHPPRGKTIVSFTDGVAPPQALNECGGGYPAADHVLLPLLLLNLEREPGPENAGRQGEERYAGDGRETGD